jgi:hypothetical protein
MSQTTLTAHLPTIDVEITRHEFPEQHAEAMTIHITATPSFDVAAQWLLHGGWFPAAQPFSLWAEFVETWQRAWYSPALLGLPWLPGASSRFRSLREPQ